MLKTRSPLAADITDAAKQALHTAGAALEDGKDRASEAAGKVGDTMRDLRERAEAAAAAGADALKDTASAAQRHANRYRQAAGRYASEQPVKTALIAAAVGAGVTALLLALARGRRRED
jgi:ElaB/YqjD/DUF883 family membrane-anchored ribosome-binding protein